MDSTRSDLDVWPWTSCTNELSNIKAEVANSCADALCSTFISDLVSNIQDSIEKEFKKRAKSFLF